MGIYVYCLAGVGHPEPGPITGLDGAPVTATEAAGFVAWVSALPEAPDPSLDSIRVHNSVVEAAAETATPLPLRFGQWFGTEAALEASLEDRRTELVAGLERVRGAQEFGVRVLDPDRVAERPDRTSGRAYLESLARREQDSDAAGRRGLELARAMREWLGPRIREQRARPLGSAGGLVAIAHLVDRHDTRSYDVRIREFPARYSALRFLFSGPWPPYGFVTDEQ